VEGSYKKAQILENNIRFILSQMYYLRHFKLYIILVWFFNISACNMEDHLRTVFCSGWAVWEEQLLRPPNSLFFKQILFHVGFFTKLCTRIYIANLFVYFTSVNKRRYEKSIGSVVGFYWIQRIDWKIALMIILCLQS
jgi:hypothetical protein